MILFLYLSAKNIELMIMPNGSTGRAYCQYIILILLLLCSCKDHKRQEAAAKIVKEWTGKEIRFPDNVPCYISGKDTLPELCDDCFHKEYKILLFVDSMGCSSCRLQLLEWKQIMKEADSLFPDKVSFLLFFQLKNLNEINLLFVQDQFDYPVFIDTNDDINRLNHFPQSMRYQCFLLDGDNKVLMVGNPVSNMKIWELYKLQIADGKQIETKTITSAVINKKEHNFGTIRKGSTHPAVFIMANTGNYPLVITRISTSCGCTNVIWDKQPIESGQTTVISVDLTPNETGILRKTITVYSNTSESPIRLTLIGTTIE